MKARRILVVGSARSQTEIARALPECQVVPYEEGVASGDEFAHSDPDAVVLCCDGLAGEHFEVASRYRLAASPIYLLSDRSVQRANQIGAMLAWPIKLHSIQTEQLREELSFEDRPQHAALTLF